MPKYVYRRPKIGEYIAYKSNNVSESSSPELHFAVLRSGSRFESSRSTSRACRSVQCQITSYSDVTLTLPGYMRETSNQVTRLSNEYMPKYIAYNKQDLARYEQARYGYIKS